MEKPANESATCHFLSDIYGVTLLVFDRTGALVERHSYTAESAGYLLSFLNFQERLLGLCGQTHRTQVLSNELSQVWAGIPVLRDDQLQKVIVAGPVFTSEESKSGVIDFAYSYDISDRSREKLLASLDQSPTCSYAEFSKLIATLYALVNGEMLEISDLPITEPTTSGKLLFRELNPEEGNQIHEWNASDPTRTFERYMLDCVQEGNLAKLKLLLVTSNYSNIRTISFPDPIREKKIMFTSLGAMVWAAAIRGGLNPELAYSLGELYIQQMETMKSPAQILVLARDMLYDFTGRVGSLKQTRHYSKFVNSCCNFINEHILEDIHVTDLAQFTGFHAHSVSKKFREETGQTIRAYIRDAKIAEAKSLLKYSSLSLSEIGAHLSFSSQSFFTATFHRVTGVTPNQFRRDAET